MDALKKKKQVNVFLNFVVDLKMIEIGKLVKICRKAILGLYEYNNAVIISLCVIFIMQKIVHLI